MLHTRAGRIAWAVVPVVLYMALIFAVSSRSDLPRTRVSDKLLHGAEYAFLGALVCRALGVLGSGIRVSTVLLAAAITTLFGATDEVHQMYVPRRDASLTDLAADAIGGTAGAAAFALLIAARRKRSA